MSIWIWNPEAVITPSYKGCLKTLIETVSQDGIVNVRKKFVVVWIDFLTEINALQQAKVTTAIDPPLPMEVGMRTIEAKIEAFARSYPQFIECTSISREES